MTTLPTVSESARPSRLPRPLVLLGLLAAGALTGLAFAPTQWWPLAIIGPAAFFWLLRRQPDSGHRVRSGLGRGLLFGLGFQGVLIPWIGVLGWYVPVALIALMASFSAVVGAAVVITRGLRWWPLAAAASWSLGEFLAARMPFGGFPWARLAWTSADQPVGGFLPFVAVSGVSFLIALLAALLCCVIENAVSATTRRPAAMAAAVMAAVLVLGGGLRLLPAPSSEGDEMVTVGMVQGNVDGTAGSEAMGYARSVTNNHLSETIAMMAKARTGVEPMPDFLLWPENSTDIDPLQDPATKQLIQDALKIADRPIYVGIVSRGPGEDERQTSAQWWDPQAGAGARYDKRNLVPFGEYIPLRDLLLPLLPVLEQVGAQGVPGTQPGVVEVNVNGTTVRLGDVICFELAYDATVYDTVTHGAQLSLVQSNNATYTGTAQPRQQFQITRVRAMELQREVVVATTSSFSGHIDAKGRVLSMTRESTAAAHAYAVPLQSNVSLAARIGVGVDWTVAGFALICVLWALIRPRSAAAEAGLGDTDG